MTLVIDLACFLVVSQISVGVCPDSHSLVARSLPINQERPASLRVHLDATTQHPPTTPDGTATRVERSHKTVSKDQGAEEALWRQTRGWFRSFRKSLLSASC